MKKIIPILVILTLLLIAAGWFVWQNIEPIEQTIPEEQQETVNEPAEMQRGTVDETYVVSLYDTEQAYSGTTLFVDSRTHRLVEINMLGEILWEFTPPDEWIPAGNVVGLDAERLSNGNTLMNISGSGIYEIDSDSNLVWSYKDPHNSHDVDRLENGNTLFSFGNWDKEGDVNVKEVSPDGEIMWQWSASDWFEYEDVGDQTAQGWTHINAVQRLSNGNTLINLRNFSKTIVVSESGEILEEYDWSVYGANTDPHEAQIDEETNNMIVCLQNDAPFEVVEIDIETDEVLWTYNHPSFRTTRDCDRLPNGNALLVGVETGGTSNSVSMDDDIATLLEVTPNGKIVWKLQIIDEPVGTKPGWFFKAERL